MGTPSEEPRRSPVKWGASLATDVHAGKINVKVHGREGVVSKPVVRQVEFPCTSCVN